MTFVQFRNNSAKRGKDIFFNNTLTWDELKEFVSDCHTDNRPSSLCVYPFGQIAGIIVEFGKATTITNLEIAFSDPDTKGTIEVTTAAAVKGTMLLLLDNSDTYTPKDEGSSPPAAFRVVVVDFPDSSTTGTSEELSFGDSEILQAKSAYSLIAASISTTPLTIPSPPPSTDL
ncbi:hypothetical protein BLNAU_21418 [Blattamonas nauphoetae]|uniref:Uncharacterized protein n=1 Tax=Blattamonas nauphoetae TaxID=2049346 RepID=A0ABQ9WVY3_9EUKA|nr:hypothetical protein BLNAU_21418 [Blattamonas nauphoetae]